MSGEQTQLVEYVGGEQFNQDIRDYLAGVAGTLRNTVRDLGFDLDWWGRDPFDPDVEGEIHVYQFVQAFSKGRLGDRYDFDSQESARQGSPSPEVQIKTGIYVIGEPTDELKEHIRTISNPRTVTLFNTREYATYLAGFGFMERKTYTQSEEVSARDVRQKGYGLGVPWFEVEAYDEDGSLEGYADGYFNPFETETQTIRWEQGEEPPQHEVWKVGSRQSHETGDRYQLSPEGNTPAKDRAKAAAGKTVILNGFPIGSVLQGGRARLKTQYKNPNRAQYASRKQILEGSGTPYQALSKGANIYKVEETDDTLVFSTTEPERDYDPQPPEEISPDAVGVESGSREVTEILLDPDEPTQFVVETDEDQGRLLGLYDPPVVREISEETSLV
jgi:hypothetical protein